MEYGFVYIWYNRVSKMFYIGSHWGSEDDGYICSSKWMLNAYRKCSQDFQKSDGRPNRKILMKIYSSRENLLTEEKYWLSMIKESELGIRYYNLYKRVQQSWLCTEERRMSIGDKISRTKKGRVFTEEHKAALRKPKKVGHTDEWKEENSKRMKEIWASGEGERRKAAARELCQDDEHKQKISKAVKESEKSKAQREELREINKIAASKMYAVVFVDGRVEEVHGLKAFGKANNIPYVTLFKAAQQGTGIRKYNIQSIFSLPVD